MKSQKIGRENFYSKIIENSYQSKTISNTSWQCRFKFENYKGFKYSPQQKNFQNMEIVSSRPWLFHCVIFISSNLLQFIAKIQIFNQRMIDWHYDTDRRP